MTECRIRSNYSNTHGRETDRSNVLKMSLCHTLSFSVCPAPCCDFTYNITLHLLPTHTHSHTHTSIHIEPFWSIFLFNVLFFLICHNIKGLVFPLARKAGFAEVCVNGRSIAPWVDLASNSTDLSLISADPWLAGVEEVKGKVTTSEAASRMTAWTECTVREHDGANRHTALNWSLE